MREERKVRYDKKNQVQEHQVKPGDKVIIKQEKNTVKPPYDPKPYIVVGVKGAQVTCWRGGKEKKRSQEKIKVVRERPQHFSSHNPSVGLTTRDTDSDSEEEVEINLDHEPYRGMEQEGGIGAQLMAEKEVQEEGEAATAPEEIEIGEQEQIYLPKNKRNQPSPRDRRRTRSQAAKRPQWEE